jgi:hypothetical protein
MGIHELAALEKLGDYCFKVEFSSLEEKIRVFEGGGGGPWRHKGNALLLLHYDVFVRPSEVKIESIPLWVLLYDLLGAMMKEAYGKQLRSQIGRYIKLDSRYPGYMRSRMDCPLKPPLMLEMKVKIKGRGLMSIVLRYENVPHYCFHYGRMWHTTVKCGEGGSYEHGIRFGEELRAPHVEQEKSSCNKHQHMWCTNFSKLKGKGPLHHT